jgi:hypothetical protein
MRTISFNILIIIIFSLGLNISSAQYPEGEGTLDNPFKITSADDLLHLMNSPDDWSKHFILTNDIDCAGLSNAKPIGNQDLLFSGSIDGKNHTISNLNILLPADNYVSFVGHNSGTLKNINIENAKIEGNIFVSVFVAYNSGNILNCNISGEALGSRYIGGIAGQNFKTIDNTHFEGTVSGFNQIGGFVGSNRDNGTITNCSAIIMVDSFFELGGFAGWNEGIIEDCSVEGDVIGGYRIGGFVGKIFGKSYIKNCTSDVYVKGIREVGGFVGSLVDNLHLSHCSSSGRVEGEKNVGGFIGEYNGKSVFECHSDADVSGEFNVGGFVGYVLGNEIVNCSSGGFVKGYQYVGGFLGFLEGVIIITYCYSTSDVEGEYYVGGFAGFNYDGKAKITKCYAEGKVNGFTRVGGFVGLNRSIIEDSYTRSNVTGANAVGGFVGINEYVIERTYSSGRVVGNEDAGGFCAFNSGLMWDSFWDKQRAKVPESDGAYAENTENMQSLAIYTAWDFKNVWYMPEDDYPRLHPFVLKVSIAEKENYVSNEINIYPNPTAGVLNISLTELNFSAKQIRIYDIAGNQIFESNNTNSVGILPQIRVEHLPSGIYLLVISTDGRLYKETFVRE